MQEILEISGPIWKGICVKDHELMEKRSRQIFVKIVDIGLHTQRLILVSAGIFCKTRANLRIIS